jgi:hypothetical protein
LGDGSIQDLATIVTSWVADAVKSGPTMAVSVLTTSLSVLSLVTSYQAIRASRLPAFRDMDERAKALAFWDNWYKLQSSVCTPDKMDEAKVLVRERIEEISRPIAETSQIGGIRTLRGWFLISRPTSGFSFAARTLFFLTLAFLVLLGIDFVSGIARGRRELITEPRYLVFLATIAIVVLVLRALAQLAEQKLPTIRGGANDASIAAADPPTK